ncbi:MAG: phosphate propanoyltransferase [Clostridia bacterium]|nr:phosphate propanoyltransferase [Clostridia bacterium]
MEKNFPVETSARHIHVTEETLKALFGADAVLHNKKNLSQPGQFACEEKVTLVGPKGELKVSILGPCRKADQVELSFTDARALGLSGVPIRESGDVTGTPGLTLVGPAGKVEMREGTIVAKRHIHMTPADAEAFGVSDKEIVKVRLDTARPLVFDDVVVRVSDKFALAMHIDTDECNAAAAFGAVTGRIVHCKG